MDIIELEKSLSELHKELERLSPAIQLTEKAIDAVNIAKAIPERHKRLINQLIAIFIDPDELNDNNFENVYSSLSSLLFDLQKIEKSFNDFGQDIASLIGYLKNNDIPNKLEAINFQLTGINNFLLVSQGQLNSIQSAINTLTNSVENAKKSVEENLISIINHQNKQVKEVKTLKTMLFLICGLIITGTVVTIFVLSM